MAFNQIDTGYKPDGALGALYQGYNAADAQQMNTLDMIKQLLANQHATNINPIQEAQAQQTLDAGAYKTRPEYQDAMTDMQVGQGMSNLAAGQTAKGLQPFTQMAKQGDLEQQLGEQRNQAKIQEIDDILNDPSVQYQGSTKQQLLQARANLINRFKETPKFAGQRELRETGTDSAEYIAELRARQAAEAARFKAAASGDKPPKTAEEGAVRELTARYQRGEIDHPTYMAEMANMFNAKNAAKIQPGTTLDTGALPVGTPLKPKESQQQYVPNTGIPTANNLEAQVKAAGIPYEPSKYEYRVVDGKVQRKAKGN